MENYLLEARKTLLRERKDFKAVIFANSSPRCLKYRNAPFLKFYPRVTALLKRVLGSTRPI